MASTCRWCLSVGDGAAELLQSYCSGTLSAEDQKAVNEDLCFCMECVVEYHRVREDFPALHKSLWDLETTRLMKRFDQALEVDPEDDLFVVEDNQEFKVPKETPAEYADLVRFPLLEILKYPYLLAHPELSEMCVEILSKVERTNSFQVYDKYPGIYLLLVHPNETVRRWAIGVARSLGNVDRDDFYDLQEIFSCMFFVVELGIFGNCQEFDIAYDPTTKMTTLPLHLYDSKNEKNYWLGICMLLTQLDTQAMDSLFLGPDKQANILQCILNTMEKELERDEDTEEDADPFWPALQCFMLILDRLGSRIWGQIEPTPAFQIITGSSSYVEEMENIKKMPWVKVEHVNDDDMVTCSQMVYDCNKDRSTGDPKRFPCATNQELPQVRDKAEERNRRRSHGVDGSMVYEEMQSLVNVLQSDLGQAMRVHNSTFLWFIPFAKSVMDLDDLIYIHEVINYLCGEINSDFLNQRVRTCDKITEIFIRILVHIIDLHLKSGCLKRLYYCAPKWVEVVVKCATLPGEDFQSAYGPSTHLVSSTSSSRLTGSLMSASNRALSQACIPLIGSLLKEGSRLTAKRTSKYSHFLNLLNKQIRDGPQRQWNLTGSEVRDLQTCLQQLVKQLRDRPSGTDNSPAESLVVGPSPPPQTSPEASGSCSNIKEEVLWDYCESITHGRRDCSPTEVDTKHEPLNATDNSGASATDSRPPPQLPPLKPDLGKIQVLKSKLSQMMSNRSSAESSVGTETLGREETGCFKPSSHSHVTRKVSHSPSVDFDEDEEVDNVPFSVLKNKLKRDGAKSPQLPDISRPESVRTKEDIIIILSEDDDDDDCRPARKEMKSEPLEPLDLNPNPLFDYNGDVSESQVFEFETEEDVVSAWANPGLENDVLPDQPRTREDFPVRPALSEPSTSWDCDTQPTSNENIEGALQQTEEGISKQKIVQNLKPAKVVKKTNSRTLLMEAKPLPTKVRSKKPKESETEAPKFTMPLPKKADPKSSSIWIEREARPSSTSRAEREGRPSSTSRAERETQASTSSRPEPSTSTPAIVPPKKVRKAAEPHSNAEKLGLKKKERKAFDLSQRSLDWVDKLRSYGQGVQVEQGVKKRKSAKLTKKSKISCENMVILGSKKKLLPPQDLQFLRQSRAKQQGAGAGTSAQPPENREPEPVENREVEPVENREVEPKRRVKPRVLQLTDEEDDDDEPLPCSQPDPERNVSHSSNGTKPVSPTTLTSVLFSTDRQTLNYCQENEVISSRSGQAVGGREEGDDDWMQFTQMGALDMEMCSQMEEEEGSFYTQRDPVDMDIDSDGQEPTEGAEPSDKTSPLQADQNEGFKKPFTPTQNDNCLFVKSGMSPITLKKAKPSTTKIYATSSSRSASLVQEMEKTTKFSAAVSFAAGRGRSVRPMLPVQKPGALKPPPLHQPDSHQMPPPKPPPPISLAPTRTAVRPPLPPFNAPRLTSPHQLGNRFPQNPRALPSAPVQATRPVQPGSNSSSIQAKSAPLSNLKTMLDRSTLIHHILHWTFDMFLNYEQYGVPLDLCAFSPEQVGCSFKSFDEYYKTFYPLLLINTFEELVSEWLKNKESGKGTDTNLRVIGNEFSKNTWNVCFEAGITSHEESHQLYPKEDDLVILTLPQNTGAYSEYEQQDLQTKHFGLVQKSTILSRDQSTTLSLTIKTCGNVTSVNQKPVHCKVVGSLINTLREFRALLSLYNSPMNKLLLAPQVSYFTCSEGAVPTLTLPGYNSDQVKAVRNGVSAVQNQARGAKISLIHGPPGTGKSKTIVGLLTKLFSEGAHSMAPQLTNRKARRMRVLLCAPSNAAVDNLMKKVILVFKERCRDRHCPQGNCGDINLVRLGNERAISKSLAAFSLDSQTKNRTQRAMSHNPDMHHRRTQLENSLDMVSRKICSVRKDTLEYKQLMEQKARLASERMALSSELKQFHREDRQKRQETQTKVLQDAHIICCTLSTSGSMVLESAFRNLGHEPFNCIIVDEAGQATETETLIPMMYRCRSLVLVGDPEQLPPTVISKKAKELNYGQSLMARLCKCLRDVAGELSPVIFLSRQYRMHPDICEFPSKYIYKNQLKTDCDTAQKRCAVSWPFQSYWLFDVKDGREVKERDSYRNDKEVRLLLLLLKLISEKQQVKVGVITPYNAQKDRINRELAREENMHLQVQVDTVDGFQGREMDCIIVSCVRANPERAVGFLGSKPRMNVTITRAKCSLFILGHLSTLKSDKDWAALIDDASKRGTIMRTEEKNFRVASRMILKKVFPSSDRPPASARPRQAPISHRRTTVPALTTQPRGSSPPQQRPRSASPPHTADRPTDPRLAARPPWPPQKAPRPPQPPQQAPQTPAEILRDPRVVELRRDAPIDGPSRGEHSRDLRPESARDPRQEQSRDLREENVLEYNHVRRYQMLPRDGGRDIDRERERRSSPGSLSYPGTYDNQRGWSPPSPKRKKK